MSIARHAQQRQINQTINRWEKNKSVRLSKNTTGLKKNGHYRVGFDERLDRQYKHRRGRCGAATAMQYM